MLISLIKLNYYWSLHPARNEHPWHWYWNLYSGTERENCFILSFMWVFNLNFSGIPHSSAFETQCAAKSDVTHSTHQTPFSSNPWQFLHTHIEPRSSNSLCMPSKQWHSSSSMALPVTKYIQEFALMKQ